MIIFLRLFVLLLVVHLIHSLPVDRSGRPNGNPPPPPDPQNIETDKDFKLEYDNYLKQIVDTLQKDSYFMQKVEKYGGKNMEAIAEHLDEVDPQLRTKLDEFKRLELDRLTNLVNQMSDEDRENFAIPQHLDLKNHKQFNKQDLHRLIKKATQDMEELNTMKEKNFKEHEMGKKFDHEKKMNEIADVDARRKAEEKSVMQQKEQKERADKSLHHPGSKTQLEEVWNEQDHLQQEFNPETFFALHDLDGNKHLDQNEVKALLQYELKQAYGENGDLMEMDMEADRMFNHYLQEMDNNKDMFISYDEFMSYVKSNKFAEDDGWDNVKDREEFTDKEYQAYEAMRQQQIQKMMDQGMTKTQAEAIQNKREDMMRKTDDEIQQDINQLKAYNQQQPVQQQQPMQKQPMQQQQPPMQQQQPPMQQQQPMQKQPEQQQQMLQHGQQQQMQQQQGQERQRQSQQQQQPQVRV